MTDDKSSIAGFEGAADSLDGTETGCPVRVVIDDADNRPAVGVIDRDGVHRVGLRPFDSERAREAARRSADSRRAAKLAGRATVAGVAVELRQAAGEWERDELGPIAFATAAHVIGLVLRGDIPIRNAGEAAEIIRALVDVGRIESGDAQRTVAVAHLSGPALAERIRQLQRAEPSAAAVAADDNPPG